MYAIYYYVCKAEFNLLYYILTAVVIRNSATSITPILLAASHAIAYNGTHYKQ